MDTGGLYHMQEVPSEQGRKLSRQLGSIRWSFRMTLGTRKRQRGEEEVDKKCVRDEYNRQECKELSRKAKTEVGKAKEQSRGELYEKLDTREGVKD